MSVAIEQDAAAVAAAAATAAAAAAAQTAVDALEVGAGVAPAAGRQVRFAFDNPDDCVVVDGLVVRYQ